MHAHLPVFWDIIFIVRIWNFTNQIIFHCIFNCVKYLNPNSLKKYFVPNQWTIGRQSLTQFQNFQQFDCLNFRLIWNPNQFYKEFEVLFLVITTCAFNTTATLPKPKYIYWSNCLKRISDGSNRRIQWNFVSQNSGLTVLGYNVIDMVSLVWSLSLFLLKNDLHHIFLQSFHQENPLSRYYLVIKKDVNNILHGVRSWLEDAITNVSNAAGNGNDEGWLQL